MKSTVSKSSGSDPLAELDVLELEDERELLDEDELDEDELVGTAAEAAAAAAAAAATAAGRPLRRTDP